MPLQNGNFTENTNTPNNGDVVFASGEKGFVTALPENPLFSFKANGKYTYNTDYLLPMSVNADGSIDATPDVGETLLADGFDSLAEGATVTDSFEVTYTTGEGSTTEWVTVTITGVNDAPIAVNDTFGVLVPNSSDGYVITGLLANDYDIDTFDNEVVADPDSDGDTFSVNWVGNASSGSVFLDGGQIIYDPADGFVGVATFEYTIIDNHGAISDTATVTLVVGPTNTPPEATDDTPANSVNFAVDEDDPLQTNVGDVLANDTDADGDALGGILVSDPELYFSDVNGNMITNTDADGVGSLVFRSDGTFDYDPGGNFEYLAVGETAYVAFDYRAFDGEFESNDDATAVIAINGENDDPQLNEEPADEIVYEAGLPDGTGEELPASFPTDETAIKVVGTLDITDPDGTDTHSIVEVDGNPVPAGGIIETSEYKLTIDGLSYTYELKDNRTGHDTEGRNIDGIQDTFILTVSDGNGGTVDATLNVEIVDDQPVIATDFSVGSITHDETPGIDTETTNDDSGVNTAEVANIVSGLSTAVDAGADGGTVSIELTDSNGDAHAGTATNLFDTETGNRLFLYTNASGHVEARVGSGTGTTDAAAGGAVALTLELLNQDADSIDARLTQARAIDHPDDTNPNDSVTLMDPTGTNGLVHVSVSVDDGDIGATDLVTATSDAAITVNIIDDAPALESIESGYVEFVQDNTGIGAATGLDYGFDDAGHVDLTYFSPTVVVLDTDGETIFTLTGAETAPDSNVVEYTAPDGEGGQTTYFTFTLDGATGDYLVEVDGEVPLVENEVNLGGEKAGAPEDRVEFTTATGTTVGITAVSGVSDPGGNAPDLTTPPSMVVGDIRDAIEDGDQTALLNASNNGLATDNQNTEQGEAYIIDTSIPTGGIVFTVGKATGGIKSVTFEWEAYDDDGNLVAEGVTETFVSIPSGGGSFPVRIELPAGVTATEYYLNPELGDGKGGFAIPTLSILERGAVDDFAFEFSAVAVDADGDPTAAVDFVVGVDGAGDGFDNPTYEPPELDELPMDAAFLLASEEGVFLG